MSSRIDENGEGTAHSGAGLPAGAAGAAPQLRTILVVDDEPDMLENVTRILRRSLYVCRTATSGQEALALLEREPPDLILTDLRMPGMDGLALLRAAKRVSSRTPVLIFTAYAAESAAHEAIRAGAAAFLPKPFSGAQLLQAVQQTLRAAGGDTPKPS